MSDVFLVGTHRRQFDHWVSEFKDQREEMLDGSMVIIHWSEGRVLHRTVQGEETTYRFVIDPNSVRGFRDYKLIFLPGSQTMADDKKELFLQYEKAANVGK